MENLRTIAIPILLFAQTIKGIHLLLDCILSRFQLLTFRLQLF